MIDPDDILESASSDLEEARAKVDATRKALQAALGGQDDPTIRQAIARLDRIADDVERVGEVLEEQQVAHPAKA